MCSETLDVGSGTRDVKYFHTDHLGSSSVITDKDGNKVSSYEYAPYGTVTRGMSDVGRGTNYLFTGKELDSTGLYFYGARYYDPEIGRFITADTIVQAPFDPQSLNRYSYCRNNPINYIDPSGHSWKSFWKRYGDFISPFGRACVTGDWENFGWQVLNMVGMILAPNPFLFAAAALNYASRATSHIGGETANDISRGLGYASAACAVVGTGVEIGKAIGNVQANSASRNSEFVDYECQLKDKRALVVDKKDATVKITYRPLSKNSAGDPGSPFGLKHEAILSKDIPHGKWEMGPVKGKGIQTTTNTVGDLELWDTHITTEKAISLGGDYAPTYNVQVNMQALKENIVLYEETFTGTMHYSAFNHNSNYAVNSVIYGAGGDTPTVIRASGFPSKPK